jgi:hypothetical protein
MLAHNPLRPPAPSPRRNDYVLHCSYASFRVKPPPAVGLINLIYAYLLSSLGAHCSVDGWGTTLQAGRPWDGVPVTSLDFSIFLILPAALCPGVYSASNISEHQKILMGVKPGRCHLWAKCLGNVVSSTSGRPLPVAGIALLCCVVFSMCNFLCCLRNFVCAVFFSVVYYFVLYVYYYVLYLIVVPQLPCRISFAVHLYNNKKSNAIPVTGLGGL